jgi:hypothetical protein
MREREREKVDFFRLQINRTSFAAAAEFRQNRRKNQQDDMLRLKTA